MPAGRNLGVQPARQTESPLASMPLRRAGRIVVGEPDDSCSVGKAVEMSEASSTRRTGRELPLVDAVRRLFRSWGGMLDNAIGNLVLLFIDPALSATPTPLSVHTCSSSPCWSCSATGAIPSTSWSRDCAASGWRPLPAQATTYEY